jgi:hypothetical protein
MAMADGRHHYEVRVENQPIYGYPATVFRASVANNPINLPAEPPKK